MATYRDVELFVHMLPDFTAGNQSIRLQTPTKRLGVSSALAAEEACSHRRRNRSLRGNGAAGFLDYCQLSA